MAAINKRPSAAPDETRFWVIWSPGARVPPTRQFTSYTVAANVAGNMAARFSGEKFYVLEAHEYFQTEKVTRKTLSRW